VDYSLAELLPRLFVSMAVVIGVMWFLAKAMKNKRLPGIGSAQSKADAKRNQIDVLGRQGLHKSATVTLVRVGDKTLLLGVTDMQVTLLADMSDAKTASPPLSLVSNSIESHPADAVEPGWKSLLEQARERTLRRA
jgi:flagellar biogenesis protein FliO